MNKNPWLKGAMLGVVILATFAGGYAYALHQHKLINLPLSRFVLQTLQKEYVDTYSDEMLARGMVYGTGDPFSMYFTKAEYESFEMQLSEKYVGIGVLLSDQDGRLIILKVFPDSPAEKEGIRPNMEIVSVNEVLMFQQGLEKAASMIRGPIGTKVSITAKQGDDEKVFTLTRDYVSIETIESQWLDNNIAYIRINSFNFGTAKKFSEMFAALMEQNPEAIILDMRDNSGGVLDETIHIAEHFLPSNAVILQARGRSGELSELRIGQSRPFTLPLYVMVNRHSASASEVLAGAIQDHQVGIILGERTYGKASIQKVFPVPFRGSAIKLTVQRYLTPSGQNIDRNGIAPDLNLEDSSSRITSDGRDSALEETIRIIMQAGLK